MKRDGCVVMAWFDDREWKKFQKLATDLDAYEGRYERWQFVLDQTEVKLDRLGIPYHLVRIDVAEFAAWAQELGIPVNTRSAAWFAYVKCAEADEPRDRRRRSLLVPHRQFPISTPFPRHLGSSLP